MIAGCREGTDHSEKDPIPSHSASHSLPYSDPIPSILHSFSIPFSTILSLFPLHLIPFLRTEADAIEPNFHITKEKFHTPTSPSLSLFLFSSFTTMLETSSPIIVTGATGFIATYVVEELLKRGYRVRGTVRQLDSEKNNHLKALPHGTVHTTNG